ncbi:hypothetical protein ACWEQL_23525 [Kitasatospora sp. NPDC004240]
MADEPTGGGTGGGSSTYAPGVSLPPAWSLGEGLFSKVKGLIQVNNTAGSLAAGLGSKDVKVELESLEAFRKKVSQLLTELEGTPASPFLLQGQNLNQANLGSGFSESTDLMAAYDKVQPVLVTLCKSLLQQIDAMIQAVGKTAGNYGGNEEHQTAAVNAVAPGGPAPSKKSSY